MQPALAHEFWIEPERFQLAPDENLVARFKNGENFEGINLGFFEHRSKRFDLVSGGDVQPLMPRAGDIPVLDMAMPEPGLIIVAHETEASTIRYSDWADFQAFANHKGFPDIRTRHLERDLPETGFSELYTRHAKALVRVGDGSGSDRALDHETEFVALTNPYTEDLSAGFQLQLFYRGAPRADAQVEIFERTPEGEVRVSITRTDAEGRATVPVQPGHAYLLDAVVLRPGPEGAEHAWETLWASLTFEVP